MNDPGYLRRNDIDQAASELYQKAEQGQPKKALKVAIKKLVTEEEKRKWNSKLQTLQVQGKFSDIVSLEEDTKVWSRIVDGLPKGQLPLERRL